MRKILVTILFLTGTVSAQFVVNPNAISVAGPAGGQSGTTNIDVNWTFTAPNTGLTVQATYDVNGGTSTVTCTKSGTGGTRTYTCPLATIPLSWSTATCGTGTGTDMSTYPASATIISGLSGSINSSISVNCGTALSINALNVSTIAHENLTRLTWNPIQNATRYEIQSGNAGEFSTIGITNQSTFDVAFRVGGVHRIKIRALDAEGKLVGTETVIINQEMPEGFSLSAVYPNPFSSQANVELSVAKSQNVRLKVYNGVGQWVATVFDGRMEAEVGKSFNLVAQNWASGVYFLLVEGDNFKTTKPFQIVN